MSSPDVNLFAEELRSALAEVRKICCLTRDEAFQLKYADRFSMLSRRVLELRRVAIQNEDSASANALLSLENMIYAVINELRMWIALKAKSYGEAWEFLITAQQAARSALRTHAIGQEFEEFSSRLAAVEDVIFPPMLFFSPG